MKTAVTLLMCLALARGQFMSIHGPPPLPPHVGLHGPGMPYFPTFPVLQSTRVCDAAGYHGLSQFAHCIHAVLGHFIRDALTLSGLPVELVEFVLNLQQAHSALEEFLEEMPRPPPPPPPPFPPFPETTTFIPFPPYTTDFPGRRPIPLYEFRFELEGETGSNSGRLIAMRHGERGTVCDDGFGQQAADFICRQLFFGLTSASWRTAYNDDTLTEGILLDDVTCTDDFTCTGITDHNCRHHEDVILTCDRLGTYTTTAIPDRQPRDLYEFRFELENETGDTWNVRSGILIAMADGQRGTVCDDGFGQQAADHICRRIFYEPVLASWRTVRHNETSRTEDILLDDVTCTDGDDITCNGITSHNCMHYEDVYLTCARVETRVNIFENYEFSLTNGTEGRLIATNLETGENGTVCDDWFNRTTAKLVCQHMFGMPDLPIEWHNAGYENSHIDLPIVLDDIQCDNNGCLGETRHNCGHSEDVVLNCFRQGPRRLRLYDLSFHFMNEDPITRSGTLQVINHRDGEEGRVCVSSHATTPLAANSYEELHAIGQKICERRYRVVGEVSVQREPAPEGNMTFNIGNMECNSEYDNNDCDVEFEEDESCYAIAILSCGEEPETRVNIFENYQFELNGPEGRLIAHNLETGENGTVCDDWFNQEAAEAICHNIFHGREGNVEWHNAGNGYLDADYPILLDDIEFENGTWYGETIHNCGHYEDVVLDCFSEDYSSSSYDYSYSSPYDYSYSSPYDYSYSSPYDYGYSSPYDYGFSSPYDYGYSSPYDYGYSSPYDYSYSSF